MTGLTGIDHSRVSRIAERLVAHRETIAISESSAGGLISAALLSVPRRVGLSSRRCRDLHPQGDGSATGADASQIGGITFRHRADGLLARRNRQKQAGR
jgi:hypothetical protein